MTHGNAAAAPIRIALIGIGKIARDQHIPALRANEDLRLAAAVSRHSALDDVPSFTDLAALLASEAEVDAVSLATPPQGRYAIARAAIDAGLHVMLEKPPGATVSEVIDLAARAEGRGVTLFASWHSREAASVDAARQWLAGKRIRSVRIDWKEDIRVWHPGQEWILEPGGLGVFDPGINALSIATAILPDPLLLEHGRLAFPANRQAPIAAQLSLRCGDAPVLFDGDFLQSGPQSWNIAVETDEGDLLLSDGGQRMAVDGIERRAGANEEYPRLYRRFAELIRQGRSDVDLAAFRLVADAFLSAERVEAAPFSF